MFGSSQTSPTRTLVFALFVLFLGDYLSCVCVCVCVCVCILRANAMKADIKKQKAQEVFRAGLTNHYAPATMAIKQFLSFLSICIFLFSSSLLPLCLLLVFSPSFSSRCALCLLWVGGHPRLKQYANPEWRADAMATQDNEWSLLLLISSSHGWNGLLGYILKILP